MSIVGLLIGIAAAAVAGFVAYFAVKNLFGYKKEEDEEEEFEEYYKHSIPISSADDINPFIPGIELTSEGIREMDGYMDALNEYYGKEKRSKGKKKKEIEPFIRYIMENGDNHVSPYIGRGKISYRLNIEQIRKAIKTLKHQNRNDEYDEDDDIFSKKKQKKDKSKKAKDKKKKKKNKSNNDIFSLAS